MDFSLTRGLNCPILCTLTAKASQERRKGSFYQEVNTIVVVNSDMCPVRNLALEI